MKSTNTSKLNKLFKGAVSGLLCSAMIFSGYAGLFSQTAYADNEVESSGYQWTRVYSMTQFKDALTKATGHLKYSDINTNIGGNEKDANGNYTKDLDWTRVMFVWKSGDSYYFTSKRNGDETWDCRKVISTYGIEPESETFFTRTALDTPFIKPSTQNTKYGPTEKGAEQFAIRFCKEGTDQLSNNLLAFQMSFYGIKYRAAAYGEFALDATTDNFYAGKEEHGIASTYDRYMTTNIIFPGIWQDYFHINNPEKYITEKQKNSIMAAYNHYELVPSGNGGYYKYYPPSKDKIKWVQENCNDSNTYDNTIFDKVYKDSKHKNGLSGVEAYDQIFKPMCQEYYSMDRTTPEGTAWCYYDFHGWQVRRHWSCSGGRIGIDKDNDDKTAFYVFVGTKEKASKYPEGYTDLSKGMTVLQYPQEIPENATVTVKEGSTLLIQGRVFNNGTILVDGGTLIIEGILDTDPGKPGKVEITNTGQLMIMKSGVLLSRTKDQRLVLSQGSSADVYGTLNVPTLNIRGYSSLTIHANGLMVCGAYANADTVPDNTLKAQYLYDLRAAKFNSFFNQCPEGIGVLTIIGKSAVTQTYKVPDNQSPGILKNDESDKLYKKDNDSYEVFKTGYVTYSAITQKDMIPDNQYPGIVVKEGSAFESEGAVLTPYTTIYSNDSSLHYYELTDIRGTVGQAMYYWDSAYLEN